MVAVWVFVLLSVGLLLGKLARIAWSPLRRCFVPSSIVGGLILLLAGPEVWGRIAADRPEWTLDPSIYRYGGQLPAFLINIVFAALFLGKRVPPLAEVWRRAGPQVAFGQTLAWGMYVVGLGLTMLLLVPMYGVPPVFGTLLEIGFEGGHGTAAGMAETFKSVGWEEGTDLALGVATVGVVMGVLLGMLLINWAVRRGHTVLVTTVGQWTEPTLDADLERERVDVPAATGRFAIQSIEPVSLHVAYLGVAIAIGALLRLGLISLEAATLGEWGVAPLVAHTPLFPLAMIGGLIVQKLHDRFLPQLALQRATYVRLQGVALDYLIVAALASLSLGTLAAHWQPLVILMTAGILWAVGVLLLLGPRVFPSYWFERSIGDFGQSLGVTATGLLLMKIVDPEYRSPAFEAFGYKQLLFEPFLGGGLVTAMAVPLVANYGPWPLFFTSLGLCVFWIAFGLLLFGSKQDKPE